MIEEIVLMIIIMSTWVSGMDTAISDIITGLIGITRSYFLSRQMEDI